MHRPERLNAFAGDMRTGWTRRSGAGRRPGHPVRRHHGVGRAFSTGGDVQYMAELAESGDARFEELVRTGMRIVRRIDQMDKPVIAAVNGAAAGAGASLALACDIRIASQNASIGLTFTRIGLHPDWGAPTSCPASSAPRSRPSSSSPAG
jgi:enoyl-CoA hydratase/carnithine racemase